MRPIKYKSYKKTANYSYTLGIFPTIELVTHEPNRVERVIFSTSSGKSKAARSLRDLCQKQGTPIVTDDAQVARLGKSDNTFVVGIFSKYTNQLSSDKSHIVLVEPDDMGNMGTILRSMLGFGYRDLAIIGQSADIWHPKCIRASMGAIFQQRIVHFATIDEYRAAFLSHQLYAFILGGSQYLADTVFAAPHSLIFGNEGAGLPRSYEQLSTPVIIEQRPEIDSLNLAIAASVAMYSASTRSAG